MEHAQSCFLWPGVLTWAKTFSEFAQWLSWNLNPVLTPKLMVLTTMQCSWWPTSLKHRQLLKLLIEWHCLFKSFLGEESAFYSLELLLFTWSLPTLVNPAYSCVLHCPYTVFLGFLLQKTTPQDHTVFVLVPAKKYHSFPNQPTFLKIIVLRPPLRLVSSSVT